MRQTRRDVAAAALGLPVMWALAGRARAATRPPLIIARGGGTADIPDGTQGAYETAIRDGADLLAASFAPTRDGVLVARADVELSGSTDVATRPGFADRRQVRVIDGLERAGWYVQDFSLAELKTLNCLAPAPKRRGAPETGRAVLTFDEVVTLARAGSTATARVVGIHATLLHPAYFAAQDLALEPRLASAIRVAGYDSPAAAMFVASAESEALRTIGELTRARRVLRLEAAAGDITPEMLKAARGVADAAALDATRLIDLSTPKAAPPTPLVAAAVGAGLSIHGWIPAVFPPPPFRPGDARRLQAALCAAGVDAVAADLAGPLARARADVFPNR